LCAYSSGYLTIVAKIAPKGNRRDRRAAGRKAAELSAAISR
jgi:hypothetical protein